MSEVTTRDGRPCRVETRGSTEVRTYLDAAEATGWRTAVSGGTVAIAGTATPARTPATPVKPEPAKLEPIRSQTMSLSPVEVRPTRKAIEAIRQTCYWGQKDRASAVELGGWWSGTCVDGAVHVAHATSATKESSARRVLLDIDNLRRLEFLRRLGTGHHGVVWSWHLHVHSGRPRASTQDFAAAESFHEYVNQVIGRWELAIISVIAVPDNDGGLAFPALYAWSTVTEDGRYVSKPARIERA